MIQANELRIGNLVKASVFGGKPGEQEWIHLTGKVDALHKDYINLGDGIRFEYRHIIAIPLSEEILLKCGFEKKGEYLISGEFKLWRYINEADNVWLLEDWPYQCDVIHLHQLQNLYFALTAQELNTSGL